MVLDFSCSMWYYTMDENLPPTKPSFKGSWARWLCMQNPFYKYKTLGTYYEEDDFVNRWCWIYCTPCS